MSLSPWQAKRQAAWIAGQATWADTPNAAVFPGGTFVSEDHEGNWIPSQHLPDGPVAIATQSDGGLQPWVRVATGQLERSRETPGRLEQLVLELSAVSGGGFGTIDNEGRPDNTTAGGYDTHGVNQVKGVLRAFPNGQGQSQGRDGDELLSALVAYLGSPWLHDDAHALQGRFARSPGLKKVYGSQVLSRRVELEVYDGQEFNFYHPPRQVKSGTPSGGAVTITWQNPPRRYDTYQNVVRRGTNPGDAAPTTPVGGTGVAVSGGNLGTSATDSGHSAAQTFNYSVFHVYSEVTTGDRWSTAVTFAVTF